MDLTMLAIYALLGALLMVIAGPCIANALMSADPLSIPSCMVHRAVSLAMVAAMVAVTLGL